MHRAFALSTKINIDRADHWTPRPAPIAIALIEFNDLGLSVIFFLFRNRFNLQLSLQCPKMNKKINVGRLNVGFGE